MKRAIVVVAVAITAGCSLIVDLTNLGDAGTGDASDAAAASEASDAAIEACTLGINKLFNGCANADASTTCVGLDGSITCVAMPSDCNGTYEQCAGPADCSGSCCVLTTFALGCPAIALDIKGTSCQPAGCGAGSYRICTKSSECLPSQCIPIRFESDASPINLSAGVCYP